MLHLWFNWQSRRALKPFAPSRRAAHRRTPGLESLEDRCVMAAGLTAMLRYDADATNTFEARLGELASGLSIAPFAASEVQAIKTAIQGELTHALADYDIEFVTGPPASGAYETLDLGSSPPQAGPLPILIDGSVDYLNRNPNSVQFLYPAQFQVFAPQLAGLSRTEQVAFLGRAMGYFAVDAVGSGLGLQPYDAFGDPRITSLNYADTHGFQLVHYQAGYWHFGFDPAVFGTPRQFSFSTQQHAKLHFVAGLTPSPIASQMEDANPPETGQLITLTPVGIAQMSVGNVRGAQDGSLDTKDFYAVSALVGDLITINTVTAPGTPPNSFVDTAVRLIAPDQTTVLLENSDVLAGVNTFGPAAPNQPRTTDACILNFVAPETGDYLVIVDMPAGGAGPYDLFVSVTRSPSKWQNLVKPSDVNSDEVVNVLDLLALVNELTLPTVHDGATRALLAAAPASPPPHYDVDGNLYLNVLDLLNVVNFLTTAFGAGGGGEGEQGEGESIAATAVAPEQDQSATLWMLLAEDTATQRRRRGI